MAVLYRTVFVVAGSGAFPVDMLRYDCCFPSSSTDARAIEESLMADDSARRVVSLHRYHGGQPCSLTPDRWRSFGWTIDRRDKAEKMP